MKIFWIVLTILTTASISTCNANKVISTSAKTQKLTSTQNRTSTAGWKTYNNKKLGFTLRYPVGLKVSDSSFSNSDPRVIVIEIDKISSLPDTEEDCAGINNAKIRKKELAAGKCPYDQSCWAQPGSEKLVRLGGKVNADDQMNLGEYEVEDVELIRETTFYIGEYQIDIESGFGDPTTSVPAKYFKNYTENYIKGPYTIKIWGDTNGFYKAISHKKLKGRVQDWYNNYDLVLRSIRIGLLP